MATLHHYHKYRSPWKRAFLSFFLIFSILFVGTIGMHILEGMPFLDAYYFTSMIMTSQGPVTIPKSSSAKIFATIISFISVTGGVAALGFLFGPFFGKIWHVGVVHMEEEIQKKKKESGSGR